VDPGLAAGSFDPADPARFADALAQAVNRLANDKALRDRFGAAGRKRVEAHFSWDAIADQTLDMYAKVIDEHAGRVAPAAVAQR